jgi:hypothetical protein
MTKEEILESMKGASEKRTICEVHREIYEICKDEAVKELLLEAYSMAKRMDKKLREYKKNWDEGLLEDNHDYVADHQRRVASFVKGI